MIKDFLNGQLSGEKQEIGIGHFRAYANFRDTTSWQANVSTHYLEDGSYVNDHITNEPISLEISGTVGEVWYEQSKLTQLQNRLNEQLGKTSAYLPRRTAYAIQKMNAAITTFQDKIEQVDRAIEVGQDILGMSDEKNAPLNFIELINRTHAAKAPIKIEAWKTFEKMRITSASIARTDENAAIDFTITLQEIRTTSPIFTANSALRKNPAQAVKKSSLKEKGTQKGEEVNQSFASWLLQ